jgi:cytochrome c oxidase subunit 2
VETPYITGNRILELLWVVIPSLLILAIFLVGYLVFFDIRRPLPGAMEINVVARQWLWEFGYRDGRKVINELRIPVNRPIKLVMTSADVIHSLFIPDYRIKEDVLPGRYTYLWLEPKRTGRFTIFCAEYCGLGHSTMLATLEVMPQEEFDRWSVGKAEDKAAAPVHKGEELVEHSGCLACHSLDGTGKVGPTLKGLFGRKVTLADGTTVTVDENYIRESLLEPSAKVVKGFPPVMPTYKGTLRDDDITAIIAYIKTLH